MSESLQTCANWRELVQATSKLISETVGIESEVVSVSAEAFNRRIVAGSQYEPKEVFKGNLVLVRVKNNPYKLSDSYGLNEVGKSDLQTKAFTLSLFYFSIWDSKHIFAAVDIFTGNLCLMSYSREMSHRESQQP